MGRFTGSPMTWVVHLHELGCRLDVNCCWPKSGRRKVFEFVEVPGMEVWGDEKT